MFALECNITTSGVIAVNIDNIIALYSGIMYRNQYH